MLSFANDHCESLKHFGGRWLLSTVKGKLTPKTADASIGHCATTSATRFETRCCRFLGLAEFAPGPLYFLRSRCFIAGTWRLPPEALRPFRYLSASIALKRKFLAVDVTVSVAYAERNSRIFRCLEVPETIEWE